MLNGIFGSAIFFGSNYCFLLWYRLYDDLVVKINSGWTTGHQKMSGKKFWRILLPPFHLTLGPDCVQPVTGRRRLVVQPWVDVVQTRSSVRHFAQNGIFQSPTIDLSATRHCFPVVDNNFCLSDNYFLCTTSTHGCTTSRRRPVTDCTQSGPSVKLKWNGGSIT